MLRQEGEEEMVDRQNSIKRNPLRNDLESIYDKIIAVDPAIIEIMRSRALC